MAAAHIFAPMRGAQATSSGRARMTELDKATTGSVGYFWTFEKPRDLNAEPMRGYIKLQDERWLILETLDETPLKTFDGDFSSDDKPAAIVGSTGATSVVLLNNSIHVGLQFGGGKSTHHYRFRTLLAGTENDLLKSVRVRALRGSFNEPLGWAGMTASSETREVHPDGRLKKIVITLADNGQSIG